VNPANAHCQNDNPDRPKRDHRQEVTDSIIRMLEEGVAPWQKPWQGLELPVNPTTDRAYRGCNAVHLMATALQRAYNDPRWMTYKQAAENDWQVRNGEKGTQIEFWEFKNGSPKDKDTRSSGGDSDRAERRLIYRVYTVFNAKQIDGIPPYAPKERTAFEAVEAGERILTNSDANLRHDQADRCFYNRSTDSIHLTAKETFHDQAGYYGTALHELSHSSGHPSRLNRATLNESYSFGDPAHAREELRAELASLFITAETGIPHDTASHAAYVGSWVDALRKDKNEIFRAAHDASAAADFILGLDRERTSRLEDKKTVPQPERENSRFVARMEPDSGTVGVHDKRFGNDHHTPIEQSGQSFSRELGAQTAKRNELSESFQEARALAIKELGQEARTYVAQTRSGIYCGKIIGETDHHIVQRLSGQTAVVHLKRLVGDPLELNSNVAITYQADKARVRALTERSRSAEIAR
jgi:antirestriction protein ArdC